MKEFFRDLLTIFWLLAAFGALGVYLAFVVSLLAIGLKRMFRS